MTFIIIIIMSAERRPLLDIGLPQNMGGKCHNRHAWLGMRVGDRSISTYSRDAAAYPPVVLVVVLGLTRVNDLTFHMTLDLDYLLHNMQSTLIL
jgi:hypothetical protein